MLVLSRHRDEIICIGDDILVTVLDIRGDKVRIGVAAPIGIPVDRQEVYDAIVRERADDPTRQTITVTLNRAEARAVAERLSGGEELTRLVGKRIEKLMQEKYA